MGMNTTFFRLGYLLLLILLLVSCVPSIAADSEYADLAPKVTKLTKAVEAKIHYHQECTAKMTEREVLYYSIAHDPSLLEPFSRMIIKIEPQNGHAIVLICTAEGKALFEDGGCTAEMDWAWKEGEPERNCDFTLKVCEAQ
jgi:hypothetical protein